MPIIKQLFAAAMVIMAGLLAVPVVRSGTIVRGSSKIPSRSCSLPTVSGNPCAYACYPLISVTPEYMTVVLSGVTPCCGAGSCCDMNALCPSLGFAGGFSSDVIGGTYCLQYCNPLCAGDSCTWRGSFPCNVKYYSQPGCSGTITEYNYLIVILTWTGTAFSIGAAYSHIPVTSPPNCCRFSGGNTVFTASMNPPDCTGARSAANTCMSVSCCTSQSGCGAIGAYGSWSGGNVTVLAGC